MRPMLIACALAALLASPPLALAGPADEPIRRARVAIDNLEDKQDRAYELTRLARSQIKLGDPEGGRTTLRRAAELGATVGGDESRYMPHILLWVADAQRKAADLDGARDSLRRVAEIARAMRSDNRKIDVAEATIERQLDAGDRDGARATFAWAIEVVRMSGDPSIGGFRPQHIASLQAAVRDFEAALETTRAVDEPGNPGFAEGLRQNCLFQIAHDLKPDTPGAARIVKDALESAYAIVDPDFRDQAVAPLAEARARIGDLDGALETLLSVGVQHKRLAALERIVAGRAAAGDKAAVRRIARQLLDEAREEADDERRRPLLGQAASALVKIGDFDAAIKIIEPSSLRDLSWTWMSLAMAREEAGDRDGARADWRRALALAEAEARHRPENRDRIDDDAFQGVALQNVLNCKVGVGDVEGARKVADELFALDPNDVSFGARLHKENAAAAVAHAIAASGDVPGALAWADTRSTPKQRAAASLAVVDALARRWGGKRP